MGIARKFKRAAARSQPKAVGQEAETQEGDEAPDASKPVKPTPPPPSFNQVQKPVHPTAIPRTQATRRGTMRGK